MLAQVPQEEVVGVASKIVHPRMRPVSHYWSLDQSVQSVKSVH